MTDNARTINFQDVHFIEQLRKVELINYDLYPEPDDSELDWPFKDKVDFYIQAYVLNSLEAFLNKKLTFEQFKRALENKIFIKNNANVREYFYEEVRLFSEGIRADKNEDLYYQIQIVLKGKC